MRVCVIGSGRVAQCIIPALREAGLDVVEQWSRADRITVDADVYYFCIKDDALPEVVARFHHGFEDRLFIHSSGSVPMSVFADAGHRRGGVLYPMQTFSKGRSVDFSKLHYFVEATSKADLSVVEQLALALADDNVFNIHRMNSEQRRHLHLAAVFACNFVNHCCTLAEDVLRPSGMDFSVMQPLLEETVAKLQALSPREAQTGPAVRWDEQVMTKHKELLAENPLACQIYELMSKSIHDKL
ncbi:MAG: DUF2520 domain-containing protein [Bacteroidaceae bacterium]|nr:DUF2520 domain-containing protein [Bacteroidaceae bacterium]